jgi:hypothetical protein
MLVTPMIIILNPKPIRFDCGAGGGDLNARNSGDVTKKLVFSANSPFFIAYLLT